MHEPKNVAIAFPPLNPNQIGRICPITAAAPATQWFCKLDSFASLTSGGHRLSVPYESEGQLQYR
jgi:hypothetical protein